MKQHPPFFRLVKNVLSHSFAGWTGFFLIAAIYGPCSIVLAMGCFHVAKMELGDVDVLFSSGIFEIAVFLYLAQTTAWTAHSNIPALSEWMAPDGMPGHSGRYEFLFTRALNRKRLFRAKTTILFLAAVAPTYILAIYINLATRGQRQAILADWMAWGSTLFFILLQAYSLLVARLVRPNSWWTLTFPFVPILCLLGGMQFMWHVRSVGSVKIYERSYLLFACHPFLSVATLAVIVAIVQTWCERRFAKLEI